MIKNLSRAGYGLTHSAAAYVDHETGKPTSLPPTPRLALHEFRQSAGGQLEHLIDGELRATVPPEGWHNYVRVWPDAGDTVRLLAPGKVADKAPLAAALEERGTDVIGTAQGFTSTRTRSHKKK